MSSYSNATWFLQIKIIIPKLKLNSYLNFYRAKLHLKILNVINKFSHVLTPVEKMVLDICTVHDLL
jgi:hypothetical protein